MMTKEHEDHLNTIIKTFNEIVIPKYTRGHEEHGGKLWEKEGLIDEAIMEAVDMVVYLVTLKQQLNSSSQYTSGEDQH